MRVATQIVQIENTEVRFDILNEDRSSDSSLTTKDEKCPHQSCSGFLFGLVVFELLGLCLVIFNFLVHSSKITLVGYYLLLEA